MKNVSFYMVEIRFKDGSRDLELQTKEEPLFYSPFLQMRKIDGSLMAIQDSDISSVKCVPFYEESK